MPASAGPTATRFSWGPLGSCSLCWPRGSPFFSHVTDGAGDPVASQVKVTSEPSATICSSLLSGLSRTGGTGEGRIPFRGEKPGPSCGWVWPLPGALRAARGGSALLQDGTAPRLVLLCSIPSKPTPEAEGWLRTLLGNGLQCTTCVLPAKSASGRPLLCPPQPLPRTLDLQDEAAIGHPCPAGDNAGVESSVGEPRLGDPNPWDGEGTSALGDPCSPG